MRDTYNIFGGITLNRQELKEDARSLLNQHYSYYFIMILPLIIVMIFNGLLSNGDHETASLFVSTILDLLEYSLLYTFIDIARNQDDFKKPIVKAFVVFSNGYLFLGTLLMNILTSIMCFLWGILLVIPGIIKAYSYSQALFIYRDSVAEDAPMGYIEAITESRRLMDGHNLELFILDLSFIGWALAVLVTLGIASIWVIPYYHQTKAQFYKGLTDEDDRLNGNPII